MHDIFISIIIGIIEGLTEFLPVSSTAHIRIAQQLFHIGLDDPYWKMYAIVIQLGAVMCLPVYFWDRILKFLRTFPRGSAGDRTILNHPLSLVMIAFVCTAGPAFLLKKVISANLENLTVIGAALIIGGAIMWAVDALFRSPNTLEMEAMSLPQAIWIGIAQITSAVFPGTSRSMSTIAAGQIAGMSRSAALEFSFFLSIPTMTVATLYDLLKTLKPGHETAGLAPLTMDAHRWLVLAIGFIVSFIVALAVVAWFMQWVRRRGFAPFAVYRIILGILVLLLLRNVATAHQTTVESQPSTSYSVVK
ncbi:MAG TPA: undecaprenyl-diphosphate phosphatase [Tepidisphaeraceae bacterium]|nr:undecaprenyl-diphosphate phosphatase [Tepidisphaeraceae bacterium]